MIVELPHKGPITQKRFPCHDAYCEVSQGRAHPYGSGMIAPMWLVSIWASEILKSIKLELHLKLVYCSHLTTHFISLTNVINSLLVFLLKNECEKMWNWLVSGPFIPFRLTQQGVTWGSRCLKSQAIWPFVKQLRNLSVSEQNFRKWMSYKRRKPEYVIKTAKNWAPFKCLSTDGVSTF